MLKACPLVGAVINILREWALLNARRRRLLVTAGGGVTRAGKALLFCCLNLSILFENLFGMFSYDFKKSAKY